MKPVLLFIYLFNKRELLGLINQSINKKMKNFGLLFVDEKKNVRGKTKILCRVNCKKITSKKNHFMKM